MQQLYNVSERFSESLDEIRGPNRSSHYLREAEAWIQPSSIRRTAAKGIFGFVIGALGILVLQDQQVIGRLRSNIRTWIEKNRKDTTSLPEMKMAS